MLEEKTPETEKLKRMVIEPSEKWYDLNLKELWEHRELLWMLTIREVQLRYRQTFLGVLWVIIQPLMTTVIFTLIFGQLMKAPSENINYSLFTFSGLLPWNIFSQSLQRSSNSLTKDLRLITKIFFPRIILPVSEALSTLVDFLVSLVVLVILLLANRMPFTLNMLIVPVLVAFTLMLSIGVGNIFAALNVYYRDFAYAIPFILQVWMFASPLAYSAKLIPTNWSWVYNLNPVVGLINGFRWAFFTNIDFPMQSLVYSVIASCIIFIISTLIFNRLERSFADYV
ncbi:MAG TPA: ABC transporter permease [Longilinea sp.]|nr:ABC transporter permease [Longilinea sp.]